MPIYAWLLNLDGEEELAAGGRYRRSPQMEALLRRLAPGVARHVLCDGDALLEEADPKVHLGRAWLPTASARAQLRARGFQLEPMPSEHVLRRVNSRAFAYDVLGPRLQGARILRAPAQTVPEGRVWIKGAFGAAGRNKRAFERWDAEAERYAERLAQSGPVTLEPHVDIVEEFSVHGVVPEDPSEALRVGAPCVQRVRRGQWVCTTLAPDGALTSTERRSLRDGVESLAAALAREGYFGPFGVDAYRYRDPKGRLRFNPCGELNARFTMGTRVGLSGIKT